MQTPQQDFNFQIPAHPTLLFNGSPDFARELNIYFNIPSQGVSDDTGILLLIAGFGGHAQSNIYKKMRRVFADNYNLVTVQCDYLGYEYMQTPTSAKLQQMISPVIQSLPVGGRAINVKATLNETVANYVDMGPIQAMDCISAVLAVKAVLEDNQYNINWGKGIAYGHSHGAYLAHLCNLFAPGLFNLLIDNSAWLSPAYLYANRVVYFNVDNHKIQLVFDYLVKELGSIDEQLYYLPYLYGFMGTDCHVMAYQGITDNLVNHHDKKDFAASIPKCNFHLVTQKNVDGKVFGSTGHGLASNHLNLFDLAMGSYSRGFPRLDGVSLDKVKFNTAKAKYNIDYTGGLPVFKLS